jgi:hypothetical protein
VPVDRPFGVTLFRDPAFAELACGWCILPLDRHTSQPRRRFTPCAMETSKPSKLFWKVTAYYAVFFLVIAVLATQAPWTADFLPVGHGERLFSTPEGPGLLGPQEAESFIGGKLEHASTGQRITFLALSFLSSILVMIPVALIYIGTHAGRRRLDPFLVRTIVILPTAVTGLVLIVQNSLALAFSLAGIVAGAGIRFRMQIRALTDTIYLLVSIGVGLACGVGSLGLAVLMSFVFSYAMFAAFTLKLGGDPNLIEGKGKEKNKGKPKDEEPDGDDDD